MRSIAPDTYRLAFLLPPALVLLAQPGRHQPCLHGCVLNVSTYGLVQIDGPSRERVFEQASRFMRVVAKGRGPMSIAATLRAPCSRRDGWSIIIGADIAFSPTSLPAHVAASEAVVAG